MTTGRMHGALRQYRVATVAPAAGVPVAPPRGPSPGYYTNHYSGSFTSDYHGGVLDDGVTSSTLADTIFLSSFGTWLVVGSVDIVARDSTGGWQSIFAVGTDYFGQFGLMGGFFGGPFFGINIEGHGGHWGGNYTGPPGGGYTQLRVSQQFGNGVNWRFDITITGDGLAPLPIQPRGVAEHGQSTGRIHRIED